MDTILSRDDLSGIYCQSMREVTEQTGGILLRPEFAAPQGNICTLYADFNRDASSGLALYAEETLLFRLAQKMVLMDDVTPQDVEDFAKEYFNVLCGRITGALYRLSKAAARFSFPEFYHGWYQPCGKQETGRFPFLSEQDEWAMLIHYSAVPSPAVGCVHTINPKR